MLDSVSNRTYLVFWENVSPEVTRVLLNRKLFGHRVGDKYYPGATEKYGCKRLGKGCIEVPLVNFKPVLEIFTSLNVQFKIREVVDFGEKTLLKA